MGTLPFSNLDVLQRHLAGKKHGPHIYLFFQCGKRVCR